MEPSFERVSELIHSWVVPGYPLPLERARHGERSTYDTEQNKAHKDKIVLFARYGGKPITEPVVVLIECDYARSTPTADVDNLAKMILDGIQPSILKNDTQVMTLCVSKRGGCKLDRTVIAIYEWNPE